MDQTGTSTKVQQVLVVDDQPICRAGLTEIIGHEADLAVCAEAGDATEAYELIRKFKPDVLTLDLDVPGLSGIELLKELRSRFAWLPILVISGYPGSVYAERVLRAGARGYVNKQQVREDVVEAIRLALRGSVYVDDQISSLLVTQILTNRPTNTSPVSVLTDRELDVYRLLGQGHGVSSIANSLHRSVKTIEAHRVKIKHKLRLSTANELLWHAVSWWQAESTSNELAPLGSNPHDRKPSPQPQLGYELWLESTSLPEAVCISAGQDYLIGRASSAEIRIRSKTVSREHARISWDGKDHLLEDLGSTNGSYLNGHRLEGPCRLLGGDRVSCGGFELVLSTAHEELQEGEGTQKM